MSENRRRVWPWVLVAVVLAAGAITCGGVLAVSSVDSGTVEVPVVTQAPAASLKPGTITEGVWPVGTAGVEPGTYQVTQPIGGEGLCYWQISTDGAGQDILSNGVPSGGVPQVSLKKGQWFTTQGCGTWQRASSGGGGGWGFAEPAKRPGPKGQVTYVVSNLPYEWPTWHALKFINTYATSEWKTVKACPKNAWRCIHVRNKAVAGGKNDSIGWAWGYPASGEVHIDVADARKSGHFKTHHMRLWLLVHELGHTAYLGHRKSCDTSMYEMRRCPNGKRPPVKFDAAQKKTVASW